MMCIKHHIEIYFPSVYYLKFECRKLKYLAIFLSSPRNFWPTLIIFILAKYKDKPLLEKAKIINNGIVQANTLF